MIITPKQPRNDKTSTRLSKLVPYMLRGKGEERCTWYMAGNLPGLDREKDARLAVEVMELLQEGNTRAKGSKTYHVVVSFHPEDRRLTSAELEDVVRRTLHAAGLEQHQYIAVRHSDQEHEHLHVAVNKLHPETLKIHHPYRAIPAYQALARLLEEELGLHRVERTRVRSASHRARDFEAHQGLESFPRWARHAIRDNVKSRSPNPGVVRLTSRSWLVVTVSSVVPWTWMMRVDTHLGCWRQFLAARAVCGDLAEATLPAILVA